METVTDEKRHDDYIRAFDDLPPLVNKRGFFHEQGMDLVKPIERPDDFNLIFDGFSGVGIEFCSMPDNQQGGFIGRRLVWERVFLGNAFRSRQDY